MEQIAVVKITGDERRNMMIPKDVWERTVKGQNIEAGVTWELRKVEPIVMKEIQIIQEEIKEVELIAETEKVETIENEDDNYTHKRAYKKRK